MTLRPSPARHPRRSHAERSAATQQHLIATAIEVIQTGGLEEMSIHQLARRAGLSSGAVQHHFDSKAALMMRVLDELLASDALQSQLLPDPAAPLAARAAHFVRALWQQVYAQPRFIAAWHIYLGSRSQPEVLAHVQRQRESVGRRVRAQFATALPELSRLPSGPREALVAMALSTLRGMGLLTLFAPPSHAQSDQLDCLIGLIVDQCRAAAQLTAPPDTR
ncbi:TetR/AcrR family transcriptional regulator [Xenophilus sp. Marseille-Q4582]|uniref:TetR/AcrR family transcriptional regulator n=1 Tax=Xenophilus sp. Marseille-Q4582 TaxID=2866600 RepID=UPI001CE45C91|nr:TetR/AcrR family transcriptional regulator [Xenophilus sp. Marseille-Q4582]